MFIPSTQLCEKERRETQFLPHRGSFLGFSSSSPAVCVCVCVVRVDSEIKTVAFVNMTAAAPQQPKQLNLNLDYFKTPSAQMRVAQGALALAALICTVEGECKNDQGRFVFFLLALVITIIEAITVIIIFVLYLDKKVSSIINLPMTFLLNDSIILLCYFINSTLAMLSIGKCPYKIEARVLAALFAIALFIVYIGLTYTSFRWWEKSNTSKETSNNGSTTITESSPTVLT